MREVINEWLPMLPCNCRSTRAPKPGTMGAGLPQCHEPTCSFRIGREAMAELTALRTQAATDKATIERLTRELADSRERHTRVEREACDHASMVDRMMRERDAAQAQVEQWKDQANRTYDRAAASWDLYQEAEAQVTALAAQVEVATALIRRWVSWCDDWHAGKPHPIDDIDAARAYIAALSTTGEPKEPAPLTPSERARAAEDVQVARAVHGEPCRTCYGKGKQHIRRPDPDDPERIFIETVPCPDCQGGDHG